MKKVFFVLISASFLFACKQETKEEKTSSTVPSTSTRAADSTAIADAVHGFYKWYGTFWADHSKNVAFTNDKGKTLKLDQTKFDTYFSHFKNSGFVSSDFITNEAAYYKNCETLWQKENKDEVASCLDADRYFCSQEEPEIEFYAKTPIEINTLSGEKASVSTASKDGNIPLRIELKKENGKWLISKAGCAEN